MMNKARINQGRLFMLHIRLGAVFLVFFIIAISFQYLPEIPAIIIAIFVSLIIPLFWSSYEILEIDPKKKVISEYVSIMGKRFQENTKQFEEIEKIFINKVKMKQNIHSRSGHVSTISKFEYHAFLKTNDDHKHFLVSYKNPNHLVEKLQSVSKKLETTIIQNY